MPLTLPQLDDRTYADLLDEARALIPSLYPDWTDHNPGDPGITLIELFAWLTEMLIFRADQVPDRHRLVFLRLLNGPERQGALLATAPGLDPAEREALLDLLYTPGAGEAAPAARVDEAVRLTVLGLRSQERAITSGDYEALARGASPLVSRALCLARRDLEANTEAGRVEPRAGHVSVIVMPKGAAAAPLPDQNLLTAVWRRLDERRALTTRHHVVAPFYAPVNAEILVARRADADDDAVREAVVAACETLLRPQASADGPGWPFGRSVYLSELFDLLEGVPGVDYVPDIALSSACEAGAARCVLARPIWHENGDPIGLALQAHHLPRAAIDRAKVVVAPGFAQLRLSVSVALEPQAVQAEVFRAIKVALKRRLHPLHGGPSGSNQWSIRLDGVQLDNLDEPWATAPSFTVESLRALARVPGVPPGSVVSLTVTGDPMWQLRDQRGELIAFGSRARELIDVQVMVSRG